MTESGSRRTGLSRESRLLLVTVAVCALVLLLMARMRFPAPPPAVETATQAAPLERLAARASYDALAADVQRVEPIIAPNLIVLRIAPQLPSVPHDLHDALTPSEGAPMIRHIAALRVSEDAAVAAIDSGARIDGIIGETENRTATLLDVDRVRRIGRIRVPSAPVRPLAQISLASLPTPSYVIVVEGTQAGVTLRPVFLGHGDRFGSPRWPRPLMPLGGIAVTPGALLFSLAGEFIGAVVMEDGTPAIAGARDVIDTGDRLAAGSLAVPADGGFAVQPLTSALRTALSAHQGVIVSDIEAGGPADGTLQIADVITSVNGWSTDNPDELLLRIASQSPGDVVTVNIWRDGQSETVILTTRPATLAHATEGPIAFATQANVGTRVEAGGTVLAPGLRAGDVITRAADIDRPTPAQMRKVLTEPTPSGFALLVVQRDGRQRIVAVATPHTTASPAQ